MIYYPVSLHLQEAFTELGYSPGDFPISELVQSEVLSLPMYPELTQQQIAQVCQEFKECLAGRVARR